MLALKIVLFLWALWYVYILVMGLYRAHLAGRLTPFTYALAMPALIAGYLMDVAANLFIAPVVFLDVPREWLVTERLQRYLSDGDGWRAAKARWICTNLLDHFDPSGKHC